MDELVAEGRSLFEESDALSAKAMRDTLAERHPEADVRALAAVVRTQLPLVRVPDGGRWGFTPKAPFTDAERWLGKPLRKSADRKELVRRYLAAFGPATVKDAEAWSGVAGWPRRSMIGLVTLRRREGARAVRPARRAASRRGRRGAGRLLPEFDNLVLAHDDRSRVIADRHRENLTSKNLRVRATVLVDGTRGGLLADGKKATVVVEPLRKLKAAERQGDRGGGERPGGVRRAEGEEAPGALRMTTLLAQAQPDLLEARQMQALSFAVHIPLVCFGIAFPAMVLFTEGLWLRTGDPVYKALAKRWSKVMLVLFAVGVVTGTILSFEFGLLWPELHGHFGEVFGLGFALEGFSFFIEAIFIAIYVYGWDRLSPRTHFLSGIPIVIAGVTGSMFVIAVNGWMNDPSGLRPGERRGRQRRSRWTALFND